MEIGLVRNQKNLIFWPLALKIDEGQQKIKIVRTNRPQPLFCLLSQILLIMAVLVFAKP